MGSEEKVLIDTNVLVRFFAKDDLIKAGRVRELFQEAIRNGQKMVLSDIGLFELVYVLDSVYRMDKETIGAIIDNLLSTECIEFENRDRVVSMMTYYEIHWLDLPDAYHAAMAHEVSGGRLYSYDQDFDRLEDIQRLEP